MKGAGKAHKELQEQQKKNLNNRVHNQTQGVNQRRAPGRSQWPAPGSHRSCHRISNLDKEEVLEDCFQYR